MRFTRDEFLEDLHQVFEEVNADKVCELGDAPEGRWQERRRIRVLQYSEVEDKEQLERLRLLYMALLTFGSHQRTAIDAGVAEPTWDDRSSLSTSASASFSSFSISFLSFNAFLPFLLRWSFAFPLPFPFWDDCPFERSSRSTLASDARTPSSVLRRRWSRQASTSGCTLKRRSLIMRFSRRTISSDARPVSSARNTEMMLFRHRSDACGKG